MRRAPEISSPFFGAVSSALWAGTNREIRTATAIPICMWSTFGELPYKEMLGKLKAVLNPAGIFVIDTTHFLVVPTGTAHKTYTNRTKGVVIQTEIDEVYKGIKRIREITNTVNGKTFHDHSEMDVLTEAGLVQLLTQFGFRHEDTYYDYSQDKPENAKRIQLIFDLH
ncbi:hypothetical protein TM7_0272 [candidate division TM7 genomosp. GTL1]|nr:hypothetical protein TM7_0272 [candidate division TM7 genomosp. GTL1]